MKATRMIRIPADLHEAMKRLRSSRWEPLYEVLRRAIRAYERATKPRP